MRPSRVGGLLLTPFNPHFEEPLMKKTFAIVALAFTAGIATQAFADRQPAMQKAKFHLEEARKELQNANADKGGHRVKAIELTDAAIAEVNAGMEFDNKH